MASRRPDRSSNRYRFVAGPATRVSLLLQPAADAEQNPGIDF